MRGNVLFASCLALSLGTVACQDQANEPIAPSEPGLERLSQPDFANLALKRGLVRVPIKGRISDRHLTKLRNRVIDPGDYTCAPNSPVFDWADAEFAEAVAQDLPELITLFEFAAPDSEPTR